MALDLLPRPRRAAQELQARRDARVLLEAADVDFLAERRPAVVRNQIGQHALECDAVQRVLRLDAIHRARRRTQST